jgi:SAM-dependent methyltransferase
MREEFTCPVCEAVDWETVGRHVFEKAGKEELPEYFRLRWEIFFDLWFVGQARVELMSLLCRSCGMMTYSPRPETTDIDAQYAYLDNWQSPIRTRPYHEIDFGTLRRIERVHAFIKPYLPPRTLRLLDYGGSDGKLLMPFAAEDHDCEVIDYHTDPLPGIRRRGGTIDELPQGLTYDLIIVSHVLEHLAEPALLLRQLAKLLTDRGLLYVEVPNEIWRDIPITYDPVTHVNFFNRENIALLCQRHGLGIIARRDQIERFGQWRVKVSGVLLRKDAARIEITSKSAVRVSRALLQPGWRQEMRQIMTIRLPNRLARMREGT